MTDGILSLYSLVNTSDPPATPVMKLSHVSDHYYETRSVSYNRAYSALGANQQIDSLVRVWADNDIKAGKYVIPEDGNQYRIELVQKLLVNGLWYCDLTLVRLEDFYDLEAENDNEQDR